MSKINFKEIGNQVMGAAAGSAAAGFINKMASKTNSEGNPMLNDELRALVLIGAGAYLPKLVKGPLGNAAGIAVIGKGTNILLAKYMPSMVSGIDGYEDEGVDGVGDLAEETVYGPADTDYANLNAQNSVSGNLV